MIKKRFIAGAVCPACQAQDKIVLYSENEQKFFECIACGHKEAEKPAEPVMPKPAPAKTEQVLHFVPMPKKKSG